MAGTRKIAAILVADVVGYSRLAGTDEDALCRVCADFEAIHARAGTGLLGENQTLNCAFATGFWSVHLGNSYRWRLSRDDPVTCLGAGVRSPKQERTVLRAATLLQPA